MVNKMGKIVLYWLLIVCFSCSKKEKASDKEIVPNIIFIMSDDHASHAISAYNGIYKDVAPTPNIDRLAQDGALFTNTFCTNSICGPSRASILTGKYSHNNGFYKNEGGTPFNGNQFTFPKALQDAGYTTAIVGKWHLWSEPVGFDYFKYHTLNGEQGEYWNPVYNDNGTKVKEIGYATNLTGDFGIDWLKNKRDKSKPFCLLYQFKAPHRPWNPDSTYVNLFDDVEMPYPVTFDDTYQGRELTAGKTMMTIENHLNRKDLKLKPPAEMKGKELAKWERYGDKGEYVSPSDSLNGMDLKKWKYQRYIKDYLATIRSVDDNVGKLLKYLDDNNLTENTIIIYTSDQGFFLGDHGWYDKRFMYEQSLRMPFIIRYPKKIASNIQIEDFALNIDIAPTLLDFANVQLDSTIQGESLVPLFVKEETEWRNSVYYHYYEYPKWHNVQPHYGIRTDRYKLIHFYYDVDIWELYDLKNDPNEMVNLYNKPEMKLVLSNLKKRLKEEQLKFGDTLNLEEMREFTTIGMTKY